VTEAELMQGSRVLGEKENLTPGLSGTFSLTLSPGRYTVYCPGAAQEKAALIVTGAAAQAEEPRLTNAVASYRHYVHDQADRLVRATTTFAKTLEDGDLAKAKRMYPHVRAYYERIEPVAESFGTLDPEIDARLSDVASNAEWTGLHRIEKNLWRGSTTRGTATYSHGLLEDVTRLRDRVQDLPLLAAQIANGGVGLLDEIANSKITGEEERYSHTDLYDFEANLQGVRAVVTALRPVVTKVEPQLMDTIDHQLAAVETSLDQLRKGRGFVSYTESTVPATVRRDLTGTVDALAESLSRVAPAIV
jgi:iron uptake system component EfeO